MNSASRRTFSPLVLIVLLAAAVAIGYLDRGNLAVAKPEIAREFGLGPVRMGLLFSAFFWSYAIFQLAAGWCADRFDVKVVYAWGFAVWSVATLSMGFLSGFVVFFGLRLLLGLGESVTYPATARLLASHFPEHKRGMANAVIDASSKCGPALGTLIGGLVVARFGWRILFVGLGCGSLVWLAFWLRLVPGRRDEPAPEGPAEAPVTLGRLLRRQAVWGTSLGMFCYGFIWSFLISWLPAYLEEERGFGKETMAVLGSLPMWAMAAFAIAGGWLSDRWIARGSDALKVRKTFMVGGFLLCPVFLCPAALTSSPVLCVILLTAAGASLGLFPSNAWAATQTLAGRAASGQWTGFQNAVGNLGGVVAPALAGWLVQRSGSYVSAFMLAAVMAVAGAAFYLGMVSRSAPQSPSGTAGPAAAIRPPA